MGKVKTSTNGAASVNNTLADQIVTQGGWVTFQQAAELLGQPESKIRTAVKGNEIFKADGVVDKRKIPGTNFEVMYIREEVLQAWAFALAANAVQGVQRIRSKGNKFSVWLTPDQVDAVQAALTPFGVTLERAFKPKEPNKGSGDPEAPTANGAEAPASGEISLEELFSGA